MKKVKNEKRIWEKLPQEIWEEIGKRLESRLDVDRFRSVCKTWRTCLWCPRRFPLRVAAPPSASGGNVEKLPFFIVEDSLYAYERRRKLTVLAEIDQGGKFWPRYFETEKEVIRSIVKAIETPRPELSDMTFLFKGYALFIGIPRQLGSVGGEWKLRPCSRVLYNKVVIFSPPRVDPRYARVDDLTVVAHFPGGKIALLRHGGWDTDFCRSSYKDIANYKGKLYAVDSPGMAFKISKHHHGIAKVSQGLCNSGTGTDTGNDKCMYLVEALEQLYLLVVEPESESESGWEVYKLSEQEGRWVEVENLGDLVFYVDKRFAFSAPRHVFKDTDFMELRNELRAESTDIPLLLFSSDDADKQKKYCSIHLHYRYLLRPLPSKPQKATTTTSPTPTSLVLSQFQNSGITISNYLGF